MDPGVVVLEQGSVAANACSDLVDRAGPQDRNTQAAEDQAAEDHVVEDRTACCNQVQVQSCPAEVHSRHRTVVVGSSHRIGVVEGSLVEEMVTDHDFEMVGLDLDLDLGVVEEDQGERHSVDQHC